jgi:hypothetical protein
MKKFYHEHHEPSRTEEKIKVVVRGVRVVRGLLLIKLVRMGQPPP